MSLRWKLSSAVLIVAIGIIVAVFAVSQLTFAREFQSIEDQQAMQMARRADNALADRVRNLNTLNYDWAAWDDTYFFVQDPAAHQDYIERNPTDETFSSIGINFLFIINNAGQAVYSKGFNLTDKTAMPIPDTLLKRVTMSDLTSHSGVGDSIVGVVVVPEGPLLVSSQPIVTSQNAGPVAGSVVMARFIDESVIEDIEKQLLVPVALVSLDNLPPGLPGFEVSPQAPAPATSGIVDAKQISGYVKVNDLDANPAIVLRVTIPRDIYMQRVATTRYFLLALLAIGVLFAATSNLVLRRMVTSRIHVVRAYADEVAEKGEPGSGPRVGGKDELARLSKDLCQMGEQLKQSRQVLLQKQEDESRLRRMIEAAPEAVIFTDLTGVIKDLNDSRLGLLGRTDRKDLVGTRFLDLVAIKDRNSARDNMEEALVTGRMSVGYYAVILKDGTELTFQLSTVAVKDEDTRPIGFVIRARDPGEQRRADPEPVQLAG